MSTKVLFLPQALSWKCFLLIQLELSGNRRCMYVYRSPLCDCIHGKNQLGLGKTSYCPNCVKKPGSQHTVGRHAVNFALRLRLGWKIIKRYRKTIPRYFAVSSRNQSDDRQFISRGCHQIRSQKDPLQAVDLLLWLGAKWYWCRSGRCRSVQQRLTNLKLGCHMLTLQGILRTHL